jgi:hypothetical protein
MRYRYLETVYDIVIRQTFEEAGAGRPPIGVTVDGVAQPDASVQLADDRAPHEVLVNVRQRTDAARSRA